MQPASPHANTPYSGPSSLGLRTQFHIGIAVFLLIVCFVSAFLIYRHEKILLEEIAYANTEMVMAAVEASRTYVREELRPRMFAEFGPDFFMIEAMSTSYVGRAVMDRFGRNLPDYQYRRVSINARNPASEANAFERRMIDFFRENPGQDNWQGLAGTDMDAHFMRFQPVFFESSCMHCHGAAEDAPQELIKQYGASNGFGHFPGELAGIVAVGVPVHRALSAIKERAASIFVAVFLGVSLFYLFLVFFFDRIVVNNLRGVLTLFQDTLTKDPRLDPAEKIPVKDELRALSGAARTMASQLRQSRQALEQHNLELEHTVARRTRALEESRHLLQEKVRTRNQELKTLNRISELTTQAQGINDIWPGVMGESRAMVPVQGTGLYLSLGEGGQLILSHQEGAPDLPPQVPSASDGVAEPSSEAMALAESIKQAFSGQVTRFVSQTPPHCLNVPISCRGKSLGVMSYVEVPDQSISEDQQELLLSIGRQIGIALESLQDRNRLVQSKELLQSVFDGITDMVMLLDKDFRIKMVNKAYLQRYQVELPDVYGTVCYEAHSGSLEACEECGLNTVIAEKRAISQEISYPNGELFLVHFYPVLNDSGNLTSVIRYSRDITDQKRMERSIQQAEKLVAMGQLAAGVAHEINNPLGIILCYVDLLKRALADFPQGLKDLTVIEKQALNSKRIVTDLLQFSRSHETAKRPTAPNNLIQEVVQFMGQQFKKQKVQISIDLDPAMPDIPMDANQIKQVLINLLMNACQAIHRQGAIRVTSAWRAAARTAEVMVWDNGIGVAADIRTKIFDPFFTTKAAGQSTGLGLSVSYGIIHEHGGEITVDSQPGQWTCFTVRLPLERHCK